MAVNFAAHTSQGSVDSMEESLLGPLLATANAIQDGVGATCRNRRIDAEP